MTVKVGDKIRAMGIEVTINKVLSQEYLEGDDGGWNIELLDENGSYRHWKQWADGGVLVQTDESI